MSTEPDLTGYIDVATRIAEFRDTCPDGSLQPADPAHPFRVVEIGQQTYICYVAAAYRTPDDTRPGIGCAYEPVPGRTPFTRFSELQNAETAAWGRAIVAALRGDTRRSVASAEEVRNREAERGIPFPQNGNGTPPVPGETAAQRVLRERRTEQGGGMQQTTPAADLHARDDFFAFIRNEINNATTSTLGMLETVASEGCATHRCPDALADIMAHIAARRAELAAEAPQVPVAPARHTRANGVVAR